MSDDETAAGSASPAAPSRVIATRNDFHAAVREALREAARAGSRELWLSDIDFADWPLGEREVVASFEQWAASSRLRPSDTPAWAGYRVDHGDRVDAGGASSR